MASSDEESGSSAPRTDEDMLSQLSSQQALAVKRSLQGAMSFYGKKTDDRREFDVDDDYLFMKKPKYENLGLTPCAVGAGRAMDMENEYFSK